MASVFPFLNPIISLYTNITNESVFGEQVKELAAQAQTMKEQVDILAMQVGGKGDGELPPQKSDKEDVGKVENKTTDKVSEQQIEEKKTSGGKVFKLLISPILILQSIVKRKKSNDSDKEIKSEPVVSSETAPDVDSKAGGNGHDAQDTRNVSADPEALIPMGKNRIVEHDEQMNDF